MFEAAELRKDRRGCIGGDARGMIFLGINCGFGNADCLTLHTHDIDLSAGRIDHPKTGIPRRCHLSPETVDALRAVDQLRPIPDRFEGCCLAFLTLRGQAFMRSKDKKQKDQITIQFADILKLLGHHRERKGLYAIRHTFRTVADAARDPAAIDRIRGKPTRRWEGSTASRWKTSVQ